MKKIIRVLLIIILAGVIFYLGKLIYGVYIWKHISSSDRLKVTYSAYEQCRKQGKSDCDGLLARGLKSSLLTQKDESMSVVLDKTKTEKERIDSLTDFYLISRSENKQMSQDELDFYYLVAYDQENPLALSRKAFAYLLEQNAGDNKIIKIQAQIANSPSADFKLREKAIFALIGSGIKEGADIFINVLKEKESAPRFAASQALIQTNAVEKIPELAEIALDEEQSVSGRSAALETMSSLIEINQIKDQSLVEKIKPLLENKSVAISANAATVLENLTGEKYGKDILTEEEMEEYITDTFLENY